MKYNRLLRDIGVLLGFCSAFYLFIVLVGMFDPDTGKNKDFSAARKRADVAVKRRDWSSASVDFRKLAENDPYNGPAWYKCANSFMQQRNGLLGEIRKIKEENGSDVEIAELQKQIDKAGANAHEVYLESKKFARFRADSLFMLAALDVYDGRYEKAMDFLDEFVDNGYYSNSGLDGYGFLGTGGTRCCSPLAQTTSSDSAKLHAFSRFWEIRRKESFNVTQN